MGLQSQRRDAFSLHWIAASQRTVLQFYRVHARIDALYKTVGVEETTHLAGWQDKFSDDRLDQERRLEEQLEERLELSTDAMIFGDILSSAKRSELLITVTKQPKVWPVSLLNDDQATGLIELKVSAKAADLVE